MATAQEVIDHFTNNGWTAGFPYSSETTIDVKKNGIEVTLSKHREGEEAWATGYSEHYRKRIATIQEHVMKEFNEKSRKRTADTLSTNSKADLKIALELSGLDPKEHSISCNYSNHSGSITSSYALIRMERIHPDMVYQDELRITIQQSGNIDYNIRSANPDQLARFSELARKIRDNLLSTSL